MGFRTVLLLAAGIGLYFLGQTIGQMGDAAPHVDGGVSQARLYYHLIALGFTVAALVLFVIAAIASFRNFKK
jgi:hypothetical protein